MDQILAQIGDTIGGIFSSPILQLGVRAVGIYLVIIWLASAYWAFRDMQQRSDNAILPYLAAAGIILFTPLFFFLAIWVYKIVRPHEKIGEVWERNLAEEALLAEVEAIHHCPGCERRIDDEWIICPTCRTRLNRVCPNCSRLVGLDWSLCAWCGKDFERRPLVAPGLESLAGARDVSGRVAAAAIDSAMPRAAASVPPPPSRPSARQSGQSRAGSSRSASSARASGSAPSAQDPLPER
jgi:RNA polymerase subunit RPABC4/transcription elongation factor Spt4